MHLRVRRAPENRREYLVAHAGAGVHRVAQLPLLDGDLPLERERSLPAPGRCLEGGRPRLEVVEQRGHRASPIGDERLVLPGEGEAPEVGDLACGRRLAFGRTRQMRTPLPRLRRNRPGRSRANRAASPTGLGSDGPKRPGRPCGSAHRQKDAPPPAPIRHARPPSCAPASRWLASVRSANPRARSTAARTAPNTSSRWACSSASMLGDPPSVSASASASADRSRASSCSASTAFSFLVQISRNADGSALAEPRPGNLRGRSREMRRRQGETLS